MKPNNISDAQIEVWEWKEKTTAELEKLDLKSAIESSINKSIEIMKKLGLKSTVTDSYKIETHQLAVSDKLTDCNSEKN